MKLGTFKKFVNLTFERMSTNKRRIEQIKAKLNVIDKNIINGMKNSSISLADLIDSKVRKTDTKNNVSQSSKTIEKSECVHLDLTSNRFYEEAKYKNYVKEQMEVEVEKSYKRIANMKKINDHSAQLLSERINTNIAVAILNADQELTKSLEFEQVGKILTDLKIFSVISFTDKFEGKLKSRERRS